MKKTLLQVLLHTNSKTNTQSGLAVLVGLILVLYLGSSIIHLSYAQQAVKTFTIKAQLDKNIVARGDNQTIRYDVADAITGKPVSGAVARATVSYADGTTVRNFTTTTDAAGHASVSWQIENNTVPGTFDTSFTVSAAAYKEETFSDTFSVV
ncbi:MAG TPA: hypothetical protein VE223_00450 [Nitrososphaeraceae archaeon]|nr:hypothetical protein [Nitrososphaeraceae archaeon]